MIKDHLWNLIALIFSLIQVIICLISNGQMTFETTLPNQTEVSFLSNRKSGYFSHSKVWSLENELSGLLFISY